MPLDDAPAGDDEARRIEAEAAQRAGGLADQHPLIATRGPGDVAKPFDRMHRPKRYCHIGAYMRWRATVCSRGEQPGPRDQADLARAVRHARSRSG